MAARVAALLAAGGSSTRMGQKASPYQSKLFVPLAGISVIERTINILASCKQIDSIVIVAKKELIPVISEKISCYKQEIKVVEGGQTRQASVLKGLESLLVDPPQYVLVHDAARCLVSAELISKSIEACVEKRAVTAAVKVNDTLKRVSDGVVQESLDREYIWAVQTPQVFEFELLIEGHRRAKNKGVRDATDDTTLVSEIFPVSVVQGEKSNIKITIPADLELAEAFLKSFENACPMDR
jgi:2-C-methyl-D-erythritol 4-phosphate cytidylyltransferase